MEVLSSLATWDNCCLFPLKIISICKIKLLKSSIILRWLNIFSPPHSWADNQLKAAKKRRKSFLTLHQYMTAKKASDQSTTKSQNKHHLTDLIRRAAFSLLLTKQQHRKTYKHSYLEFYFCVFFLWLYVKQQRYESVQGKIIHSHWVALYTH